MEEGRKEGRRKIVSTRKKNYKPMAFVNISTKIYNVKLTNRFQQYIKKNNM
jgi:hypothetical protein